MTALIREGGVVYEQKHVESQPLALAAAAEHKARLDFLATQRVVEKIKCLGCGAVLETNEDFQTHCMEVEHDEDFAYDCEMIKVTESKSAGTGGNIDLGSDTVLTFYNTELSELSNLFPAAVIIGDQRFPTAEHAWQHARAAADPAAADKIAAAETVAEAQLAGAHATPRKDWDTAKDALAREIITLKFTQHPELRTKLLATAGRTIVMIDQDQWAGMMEVDGRQTGHNTIGKLLMEVRDMLAGDVGAAAP